MLAPLAESAVTEESVVRMGMYSLDRWPQIIESFSKPVFFQREGTLIVWHRQDAPEAERFTRQLDSTTRSIPELPAARHVNAEQIQALEPALGSRFAQGLYLPQEGQLDNRGLLESLLEEMRVRGVSMNWGSRKHPGDFRIGSNQPDWVLDCRGVGAKPQWNGVRAVRGEVIRLFAPEVDIKRPTRLIHPRYPLYIAPKPNHLFVVGATEIESEDFSPASVRSTLELLSAAYTLHSGFAEARIVEIATQCRPALADNLPAIRLLANNVIQVNGLYRHGFMIAPAVLDSVMKLVKEDDASLAHSLSIQVHDTAAVE